MPPYRERRDKPRELAEAPAGMVSDMVRQFADAYAFLRELVQNGMDAGSERLEVALVRGLDGEVRTSVADGGSGMTLKIIEGALLTLFSSSKEGDSTKIGKYGVGFISVLAIEPDRVEVDTWRAEGSWRVRIQLDQSYVVEEGDPREGHGTTVTLFHHMESSAFDQHAASARESLRRWCRHAKVPIFLTLTDYANPRGSWRGRVDVPLTVHAAVSVSDVDGEDLIVIGPSAGAGYLPWPDELPAHENAERFVGFYNRGLTLYESTEESFEGLDGLRVKISSPKIKHTLSRDNVRREKAFDELTSRARQLAKRALPPAVEQALRDQAIAVGRGGDGKHYLALLEASASPQVALGADRIWFPLTDPVDGEHALTAKEIIRRSPWREPLLTWTGADPLTGAFAVLGRPVVLCPAALVIEHLAALYDTKLASRCEPAHQSHLLVAAPTGTASDSALCQAIPGVLACAGMEVPSVTLVSPLGARPTTMVIAREAKSGIIAQAEAEKAARKWAAGNDLVLDARHEAVRLARERARKSPRFAAHVLGRLLLLERKGTPAARVNDALLRHIAEPE